MDEQATIDCVASLRQALALQLYRVVDIFRDWDDDGNGTVSKTEFRKALVGIFGGSAREHAHALFDEIDADASGYLSYEELHSRIRPGEDVTLAAELQDGALGEIETERTQKFGLRKERSGRSGVLGQVTITLADGPTMAAELQRALSAKMVRVIDLFREWDDDQSGSVSKHEFRRILPLLGIRASKEASDQLFDTFDLDSSGQIGFRELNSRLLATRETAATRLQKTARGRRARARWLPVLRHAQAVQSLQAAPTMPQPADGTSSPPSPFNPIRAPDGSPGRPWHEGILPPCSTPPPQATKPRPPPLTVSPAPSPKVKLVPVPHALKSREKRASGPAGAAKGRQWRFLKRHARTLELGPGLVSTAIFSVHEQESIQILEAQGEGKLVVRIIDDAGQTIVSSVVVYDSAMQALQEALSTKVVHQRNTQGWTQAPKAQLPIWSAPGGFEFHFELQAHERASCTGTSTARMLVEFGVEMRLGEHNLLEEPSQRQAVS